MGKKTHIPGMTLGRALLNDSPDLEDTELARRLGIGVEDARHIIWVHERCNHVERIRRSVTGLDRILMFGPDDEEEEALATAYIEQQKREIRARHELEMAERECEVGGMEMEAA